MLANCTLKLEAPMPINGTMIILEDSDLTCEESDTFGC